jgi:hypothetical protein
MFEAAGTALELNVLPLAHSDRFIGVMASHARYNFPEESGFVLNGPSESVKGSRKNALMAFYPTSLREKIQSLAKVSKNLNYEV